MEGIDGGLHPAVDGQNLGERASPGRGRGCLCRSVWKRVITRTYKPQSNYVCMMFLPNSCTSEKHSYTITMHFLLCTQEQTLFIQAVCNCTRCQVLKPAAHISHLHCSHASGSAAGSAGCVAPRGRRHELLSLWGTSFLH